jgi:hypothetical protein
LKHKSHLPPIEELGKTISMEQLLEKIQQHINERQEKVEATTKVTIGLMEEQLVQPTKVQTMIQEFMATLVRYMKSLIDNSSSHKDALKELLYHGIISLDDKYEVWEAYIKYKGAWIRQNRKFGFANNYILLCLFPTAINFILIITHVNIIEGEAERFCNCFLWNSRRHF